MEGNEILLYFVKIIFVILAVIAVIQLVLKIIGYSPIDIQLLYVVIGGIVSYLFIANFQLGKFVGGMNEFKKEMREFKEITKNSFAKLREDLKKK